MPIGFMDKFSRSWEITKLTFSIIKNDKTMLLFPLLSSIFSILFVLALIVPAIFLPFLTTGAVNEITTLAILFVLYFGLAFLATFFNVCVVYYTKETFANKQVTFSNTLGFAFSNIGRIAAWALVSATVSVLIRILENATRRMGGIGQIISRIALAGAAMGWAIATVFVIPSIVYDKKGPFAAIKQSVGVLRKTWGESLIRYVGLGMIQGLVTIIGGALLLFLAFMSFSISATLGIIMIVLFILFLVVVSLVFQIANDIFNTALYEYAQNGVVPRGFNQSSLSNAFAKDDSNQNQM